MTSKLIKIFAVILCGCLAVGFSGCDGGNDEESSTSSSGEEDAVKTVKIGYIYLGSANDKGFTGQINDQRLNAAKYCSHVETYYIENVSVSDFESAVKALSSAGCEVIVSCSPIYTNILSMIAAKYMNIDFINYNSVASGTSNVSSYAEAYYQGAYIGGTIAAFNSEKEKIGIVVDSDMPGIYSTIDAAALGMRTVFADAEMYVVNANTDKEIEEAINALYDNGCDVIICYTESSYSAEYCEKKGIKFVGCHDYSISEDEFKNMIMYFYSKRDSYFLAKFKQLQYDEWENSPYIGTMANGRINVSEALKAAKTDSQRLIDHIAPLVSSGQLYIFEGELKDNSGIIKYMQNEALTINQIFTLDWYVQGVKVLGNFRKPQEITDKNNFVVKS